MEVLRHNPTQMRRWIADAIRECERKIRSLDFQLKVDRDYVESPEADPSEVEYYRCQIALNLIERECLERKSAFLKELPLAPRRRGGRAV